MEPSELRKCIEQGRILHLGKMSGSKVGYGTPPLNFLLYPVRDYAPLLCSGLRSNKIQTGFNPLRERLHGECPAGISKGFNKINPMSCAVGPVKPLRVIYINRCWIRQADNAIGLRPERHTAKSSIWG